MDLDDVLRSFTPSLDLANPDAVFDKCLPIALEFMTHAAKRGLPSVLVQVSEYYGDLSRCHPEWEGVPADSVIHYLVRIDDKYVDWTRRQFDSLAPVPVVLTDLEADGWAQSWEIAREGAPDWIRDTLDRVPPISDLSL